MPTQAEIKAAASSIRIMLPNMHDDVVSAIVKISLESAERARWQPIETAPKDGTLLWLEVEYDHVDLHAHPLALTEGGLATTIGHNNVAHDGDDVWHLAGWCWSQDRYTEGKGSPTHWQPLPSPPETK
jgi:hypothetical protein